MVGPCSLLALATAVPRVTAPATPLELCCAHTTVCAHLLNGRAVYSSYGTSVPSACKFTMAPASWQVFGVTCSSAHRDQAPAYAAQLGFRVLDIGTHCIAYCEVEVNFNIPHGERDSVCTVTASSRSRSSTHCFHKLPKTNEALDNPTKQSCMAEE